MAPVRHALLTFAAAVSLVLCVATVALWVRGYFVADHFYLNHRRGQQQMIRSASGVLTFEAKQSRHPPRRREERPLVRFSHERGDWLGNYDPKSYPSNQWHHPWKLGPFGFVKVVYPRGGWMWRLNVQAWFLVALTLPWPAYRYGAILMRRWRQPAGHYLKCGYDLRATPDRCPECGAVPSGRAAAA